MFDLKAEREAKGMTQQELADKCGVIRQTVSAWETGQIPIKNLPVSKLKLIAQALDVNLWASNFFED